MISCNKRFGLAIAAVASTFSLSGATELSAFSALSNCSPIGVSIQVGSDYSVTFEGSPENVKYAGATVQDGTLYIQNEGFTPAAGSKSVVATVTVPKDALTSITSFGSGNIASAPSGLEASTFSVLSQGSGTIDVVVAVSGAVEVESNGSGSVNVGGSSETAELTSNGSGPVGISGIKGDGTVSSNGSGDVYMGASADSTISGSSNGSGTVYYGGNGTCSVKGCEEDESSIYTVPVLPTPQTIKGTTLYSDGICQGVPFVPSSTSGSPSSPTPSGSPSSPTPSGLPSLPPAASPPASAAVEATMVLSVAAAMIAAAV